MHSNVSKIKAFKKVTIDPEISGNMLAGKMKTWCEQDPTVLCWEIEAVQYFRPQGGFSASTEISEEKWIIEFNIIKCAAAAVRSKDGSFNNVAVLTGTIQEAFGEIDGRMMDGYELKLNDAGTIRGTQLYKTAKEMWDVLTNLPDTPQK